MTCYGGFEAAEELDPNEGKAGVALLTTFRFARTMALGAPLVLCQPCVVPLWAQLERLEFHPCYFEPHIDDDPWSQEAPCDPKMDE